MKEASTGRPPIAWPTTLFIAGTTLGALAWPLYAWAYGVTGAQVALALGYFLACGMSITAGYHRLVAHRAGIAALQDVGQFTASIDELRTRGLVGEKTFERIRDAIMVR